jgi:hypothetical protein
MTVLNALSCIQLWLGTQDSEEILEGMFDSGVGLHVGCRTYHEYIMRRKPDVVAGIHRFEDSGTSIISLGGITVDGADPKVTAVISYTLPYMSNDSACLLKIALADGSSIGALW